MKCRIGGLNFSRLPDGSMRASSCLSRSEVNRASWKASRLKALAVLRWDSSTQGLYRQLFF